MSFDSFRQRLVTRLCTRETGKALFALTFNVQLPLGFFRRGGFGGLCHTNRFEGFAWEWGFAIGNEGCR